MHREPALGMSAHQRRRVADIIKGVYWRLFWSNEKNMKKLLSIVICVMALLFAGCKTNASVTSSKVETGAASDITTESVVLHGVVNVDISQYAFSVSSSKQVYFSPGNLQYTQSTNIWSFAENQYDYIGTDNVTGGSVSSDEYGDYKYGTALADKVDLFGWSTATTNFGVSTSTASSDYSGSFVDWGTNKIGNDAPNTWRTLTYDEWDYVVFYRPNASSLKGVAQVNGVNGLILLPDSWSCPADITFKSGFHSSYGVEYYAAYQTFTADQWSKLASAGAVFLPAASYRYGSSVRYRQYGGGYWSATEYDGNVASSLYIYSDVAHVDVYNRSLGRSVRLVKDL